MFENLFANIEAAVDRHPKLTRVALNDKPITASTPANLIHEAEIVVRRGGSCSARIRVKLRGSRKRAMEIYGDGDSPTQAAANLIDGLDHWATALE